MKKIYLSVVFMMMALLFVGCGTKSDPEAIKIWWPSGVTMEGIIEDAITSYQTTHPDTKIEVVYKPMEAFDAYKIVLNDDSSRPDIAILDHVYVQALASKGYLADLKEFGSDDIMSSYPEALYEANMYNDKVYALPFSANTVVLMYNKDILKAAGVDNVPTTIDELVAACEKVEAAGYTAFAQPLNDFSTMEFASYVARRNGQMVSNDYKTITLDTPEVMAAINDWVRLSAFVNKTSYEEDQFYIGKVAFVEMGSWALSKVTGDSARFDCGFAEMVTLDSNTPNYSGLGLYSLCIAEKSTHKEEAYEFAKFLSLDKTVQLAFNQEKNLFPVTKEALQDDYYTQNEALSVYASQLLKVAPRPATPVWPDLKLALVDMLHSAVLANSSTEIEAIVKKYQTQAQEATDRVFK